MNERIKELHDKAFDGIDILEPNWFLKHNKKFAELIIRECIQQATKDKEDDVIEDFNTQWNAALDCAADNIKHHFGVE